MLVVRFGEEAAELAQEGHSHPGDFSTSVLTLLWRQWRVFEGFFNQGSGMVTHKRLLSQRMPLEEVGLGGHELKY